MGEFFRRYVLDVYQLQEQLNTEYPNLPLGDYSEGGGWFDSGTLYYCTQIWTSDNNVF